MTAESTVRLTWNRCAIVILLVMVVGCGLAQWKPVWFAPPALETTLWTYVTLSILWIPALLICVLLRPTGKGCFTSIILVVIGGVAIILISLPGILMAALGQPDCNSTAGEQNTIVSECVQGLLGDTYLVYHFEGTVGSPFARLVDTQTCTELSCS